MKKLVLFLILIVMLPHYLAAEKVTCDVPKIDINEGDVVSAAVLNEILTRINNVQTGGMSNSDLIGDWTCTSVLGDDDDSVSQNIIIYYSDTGLQTMTQSVEVTASGDKALFSYRNNFGQAFSDSGPQTCEAQIVGNRIVLIEKSGDCSNSGSFPIEKKTDSCFVMENNNKSVTTCKKTNLLPSQPLDLNVVLESGSLVLSWTAGDATATSYDVQRKTALDGTFASIGTATEVTLTDTDVTANADYWYRVFAKNDNGTSTGSNVVKLTYVTSTAPAAATSLAATVGTGFVSLTWTAGDDTATSYEIKKKIGTDGTYSVAGTTSTTTSFSDTTGFTDGTSYSYQVFAKNANGTAAGSNVVTVTYE